MAHFIAKFDLREMPRPSIFRKGSFVIVRKILHLKFGKVSLSLKE
jgi:hypothetical protein